MIRRLLAIAVAFGVSAGVATAQETGVASSLNRHNLSTTGPGPIKSETVNEICVFCHAPHNAEPQSPLWNQELPAGVTYTPYSSSTLVAAPGQPTGASKLCLSCHDGTVAVGRTLSGGRLPIGGLDGQGRLAGSSVLGLNLSNDHPISFVPVTSPEIAVPPPTDPVKLDGTDQLQCTSCHDPHEQELDPVTKKFLVKSNQASALCLTCHVPQGWQSNPTSHRLSARPFTQAQGGHTGYATVAANGCEGCHKPHAASWPERLLKEQEAMTCGTGNSQCHGGTAVAAKNIYAEFTGKLYRHPSYDLVSARAHDPAESPANTRTPLPEKSLTVDRHAACSDCHNSHAAYEQATTAPKGSGRLAGVWGVRVDGMPAQPIGEPPSVNEYEICFKCHGDSVNKPQRAGADTGYGPLPVRQVNDFNLRMAFDPNGISSHPVVQASRNRDVPSLFGGWTSGSLVYCTDCHDNDDGPNAPGGSDSKPKGPHASRWPHLLAAQYSMTDNVPYSPGNFALCFKCHDPSILLDEGRSAFPAHRKHVVGARTACFVCHDAHGLKTGVPISQSRLINFAVSGPDGSAIVGPSASGRLEYLSLGSRNGLCYLRCHGKDHDATAYGAGH